MWNNQVVNPAIVIENSFTMLRDWKVARHKAQLSTKRNEREVTEAEKWKSPTIATIKLNVNGSFFIGANTFSVGMVIR